MTGEAKAMISALERQDLDQMVRDNLGLVYDLARRMDRASGSGPERSDLVSAGVIGLIQAAQTFDRARGLAFSTIAVTRIRGAMLDEMRKWDQAPRSVRSRERIIKDSMHTLRARLERDPTQIEVAGHLAIAPEQLQSWCDEIDRFLTESLDMAVPGYSETGKDLEIQELIPDDGIDDVVDLLGRAQAVEILREKLMGLPERERAVLSLYYVEGLRLKEIAQVFGVTESRISQIRHGALRTLRSMMTLAGVEEW